LTLAGQFEFEGIENDDMEWKMKWGLGWPICNYEGILMGALEFEN
jgi:hypothetical protein